MLLNPDCVGGMDNVPSIFVLTGGAAVVAVVGFVIVHRLAKPINLEEHQGFLDAMLSIVGTLVSIVLGLLVAAALDHYQDIVRSVDAEAASVTQIFRLSSGLPGDVQKTLHQLCIDYCDEVINEEWPAMARGELSNKVLATYAQIVAEVVKFHPSNDGESNLHSALISAMQQIGDCRRQRILALHSPWIGHLMPILLVCAAIVLAFTYLYVRRGAIFHAFLIGLVAIALGGNLGLVFVLSNPFSGDWRIPPRAFELNVKLLQEVKSMPELYKLLHSVQE